MWNHPNFAVFSSSRMRFFDESTMTAVKAICDSCTDCRQAVDLLSGLMKRGTHPVPRERSRITDELGQMSRQIFDETRARTQ